MHGFGADSRSSMQPDAPTTQRKRWYRLVTLLLPLLLLLILEGGLRLLGLGGRPPLFVAAPERPGYLQANPNVARRYMGPTTGAPAAYIDPIAFRARKAPGAQRIVVQGASTAAGFPFGPWVGLAGMLGDRLEAVFPDREIEVISTAMAAVNSYTLLDLVDEIIAIEPDAVMIYAGHNEYLGILGESSALTRRRSRSATRLHLALKRFGLYEGLGLVIAQAKRLAKSLTGSAEERPASLMASAATGALTPFESESFQRGVEQFEANLTAILEKYHEAGIPVYLGTLVSNDKDQPPFASRPSEAVDPELRRRLLRTHADAERTGDFATARDALEKLLTLDDDDADNWFALGRLELAADRPAAARDAFRNARDRDQLRFRAPTAFNRILRELANRTGATLVDVERHLAAAVPHGITGDELLLEHVHPNADGYFLLADAYLEALQADGRIGDWSAAPSRERARRDMPVTTLDRILATYDVGELESDFPFRETRREYALPPARNRAEKLAQQLRRGELEWLVAMDELLRLQRDAGRLEAAAVVARIVARAAPTDPAPNYVAGILLMQLKRFALARRYLERGLEFAPEDPATLSALVQLHSQRHDPTETRRILERLKTIAPSHSTVRRFERELP